MQKEDELYCLFRNSKSHRGILIFAYFETLAPSIDIEPIVKCPQDFWQYVFIDEN